jgi:hypothetical protein
MLRLQTLEVGLAGQTDTGFPFSVYGIRHGQEWILIVLDSTGYYSYNQPMSLDTIYQNSVFFDQNLCKLFDAKFLQKPKKAKPLKVGDMELKSYYEMTKDGEYFYQNFAEMERNTPKQRKGWNPFKSKKLEEQKKLADAQKKKIDDAKKKAADLEKQLEELKNFQVEKDKLLAEIADLKKKLEEAAKAKPATHTTKNTPTVSTDTTFVKNIIPVKDSNTTSENQAQIPDNPTENTTRNNNKNPTLNNQTTKIETISCQKMYELTKSYSVKILCEQRDKLTKEVDTLSNQSGNTESDLILKAKQNELKEKLVELKNALQESLNKIKS